MKAELVHRGRRLAVAELYSAAGLANQFLLLDDDGGGPLLLDCGDGALRDLHAAGFEPTALEGVLISHGHFDHLGGLHSLLGYLRMVGRDLPLELTCPRGCRELETVVNGFLALYPDLPFVVEITPLEDGDIVELGPWSIEALAVNHAGSTKAGVGGPIPALGYRVELGEETLAYSGDSGPCEALETLCRDADFALVEATWDEAAPTGEARRVHLTRREAETYGALARQYRLIHRVSPR